MYSLERLLLLFWSCRQFLKSQRASRTTTRRMIAAAGFGSKSQMFQHMFSDWFASKFKHTRSKFLSFQKICCTYLFNLLAHDWGDAAIGRIRLLLIYMFLGGVVLDCPVWNLPSLYTCRRLLKDYVPYVDDDWIRFEFHSVHLIWCGKSDAVMFVWISEFCHHCLS